MKGYLPPRLRQTLNMRKYISVGVVGLLLALTMLTIRHIHGLDNQIKFKQIQLKDNSAQLKLLDSKYDVLNKELDKSGADKAKIEQQLQDLQKQKDDLQKQLSQKQADRVLAASNAVTGTTKVYAAESGCDGLRTRLAALGISGGELSSAITLATRESTCRTSAVNSIGACGEFQSLPCGKWGQPGTDQYLLGAIAYVRGNYGSFAAALGHSYTFNWY